MKDYIEREAAIKGFTDMLQKPGDIYPTDITTMLNGIPAADVKPVVRGEWVTGEVLNKQGIEPPIETWYWRPNGGKKQFHENVTYCSACLMEIIADDYGEVDKSAFCPHCGAKMKSEADNG